MLSRNWGTRVLAVFVCLSMLISSTAKTGFSGYNFEDTLASWLGYLGFRGSIVEHYRFYNDIGYLEDFKILLEEHHKKADERTNARVSFEIKGNESYEFTNFKLINKDIKGLPYMYADWIARFAISYAIKNVSKLLGLRANTEKISSGLYKVTIDPAKTTEPSRYRFTRIEVFYEVKNLFLNIDLTIKGEKDYLILGYLKSEVHGILRALENGNFPSSTLVTLFSELLKGSSDYLIRDLLKLPEASHEILLELERNPEISIEEWTL